jgi:hypothetical protein
LSKKKRKKTPSRPRHAPVTNRRGFPGKWVVLGLAVLVIAAGTILYIFQSTDTRQTKTSPPGESRTENVAPSAEIDKFNNLIGRWRRVDGGYMIDIRRIDANGQMSAAYYNPKSIHVSRAAAALNDGAVSVFIELKDVGYPGSAYTLMYYPEQDILSGVYFQAVVKQSFEVIFTRVK